MAPAPLDSLERLADTWALDDPTERKRLLIIVNPYATTVSVRLKNLVVYALQGRYEVTAAETTGRGHATELCREAADEGYEVVVAFGGDGTVNEAANGLIGTDVPLTCLPGGSTNVFCRTLGIPLAWFPRLLHATPEQREQVELSPSGLHWDGIDEDISIAGLLAGRGDMTHLRREAAE